MRRCHREDTALEMTDVRFCSGLSLSSSSSSLTSSTLSRSSREEENDFKKNILVITGGSGWLGSTIAKLAYQHWESLQEIRVFDCTPPDKSIISGITGLNTPASKPKVSYYPGNVLDEDSLLTCFVKADVVIHCAAVVENGSFLRRKRMKSVNVDGTQKVVQACLECGVRGLVFTGSLLQAHAVRTDTRNPVRYDELYQPKANEELTFSHYGSSKSEAENLVLLANGQEGRAGVSLHTCSLRFPMMYGEGDTVTVPPAIQGARRCFGYLIPIGFTGNNGVTSQPVYVGNAAWAHVLAAQRLLELGETVSNKDDSAVELMVDSDTDIGGKFFYIGDHSPICSLSNFFAQFLRPLGYRVSPYGVPIWLAKFLVFFLELLLMILAFLHVDVRSSLNRGTMKFLQQSHSFSWDKAKRELGYKPLYSHRTALAHSMEFYHKF